MRRRRRAVVPEAEIAPPVAARGGTISMTATEAQSLFGRMFDEALRDQVVIITRHGAPRAVLLSIDRYNALVGAENTALDALTSEFDAMLERMQAPGAAAAMQKAFSATPEQLGKAAVAEARENPPHRSR